LPLPRSKYRITTFVTNRRYNRDKREPDHTGSSFALATCSYNGKDGKMFKEGNKRSDSIHVHNCLVVVEGDG